MTKIKTNVHEQLSDLTTPVGLFLKIREQFPVLLMLESSDYESKENSFSFIGFDPLSSFILDDGKYEIRGPNQRKGTIKRNELTPTLEKFYEEHEILSGHPLAKKFNGMFGYFAFEAVRYYDTMPLHKVEPEHIPDVQFHFFRYVIAFDHYSNGLTILENRVGDEPSKMHEIISLVNRQSAGVFQFTAGEVDTNLSDADYMSLVTKAKAHCKRGDVFQLVLSRRFVQSFKGDDFNVYRALRAINPSPYLFYFDYGDFRIMGSSPEAQLVIREGKAEIHPIAGTIKRTGIAEEDHALAIRLSEDPKENAEHNMLVDLARNDLSKNCNEVGVSSNKIIQYFSHVIHLVSKVVGQKNDDASGFQVFEDSFPAGTLTGAPKYKAIELIARYEPNARGFYGGAIGYMSMEGNVNMAITIRSLMSRNHLLFYQAGAGIVIDSREKNELKEVENKVGAMRQAIKLAEKL